MDAFAISLFALVVSFASLVSTTILAIREGSLLRRANYIPMIDLISEFRSKELYEYLVCVTTRLGSEHEPSLGISGLPEKARGSLINVAYYYQSFAWLAEFRVLRREHLLAIATGLILAWEAIRPFVESERKAVNDQILTVLERSYKSIIGDVRIGSAPHGRRIS
jgi:hypothetical protein